MDGREEGRMERARWEEEDGWEWRFRSERQRRRESAGAFADLFSQESIEFGCSSQRMSLLQAAHSRWLEAYRTLEASGPSIGASVARMPHRARFPGGWLGGRSWSCDQQQLERAIAGCLRSLSRLHSLRRDVLPRSIQWGHRLSVSRTCVDVVEGAIGYRPSIQPTMFESIRRGAPA